MYQINAYKAAKNDLRIAKEWVAMLGKSFAGGGGGEGKLHSLELKAKIYYQEYNGSQNYHNADVSFACELAEAVKAHFDLIVEHALERMERRVRCAAVAAQKEHAALMEETGLLIKKAEGEA